MLNQIEVHPLFVPVDTIEFCRSNGIVVQAYAPLGGGPLSNAARASGGEANGTQLLLRHAIVTDIAEACGKTPAQVILRWGIQGGLAVVAKSGDADRIAENVRLFDFALTAEQVSA